MLFPAAPPSGGIVVDEARLIAPLDQVDLEGLAIALRRDRGYPITVVTIQSLSAYGAAGYSIADGKLSSSVWTDDYSNVFRVIRW